MVDLEVTVEFCYTCLKVYTAGTSYMRLEFSIPGDVSYTTKLKYCIPEMTLENIDECILCKQCSIALDSAYLFRTMCLETESKLQSLRESKEANVANSLREEKDLGFSVVNVTTLVESEETTGISNINTNVIDTSVNCDKRLTDEEIVAKCCATLPVLKNLTPQSLQCWVVSEKIIPIRSCLIKSDSPFPKSIKDSFWCSICDKYIRGKGHYNFHIRKHLNMAYTCTSCSVDCKNQKNFHLHRTLCPKRNGATKRVSIKTPNPENNNRKIKKKTNIIKVKFNSKIRKWKTTFKCKMCTFKTTNKAFFERHNESHVGTPPFQCKFCSKIFQDSNKYTRHMQEAKHTKRGRRVSTKRPNGSKLNLGPPPFECTYCLKVFHVARKFLRHIREAKHTKNVELQSVPMQVEIKKEKHFCDVCAMDFISEFELADHRKRLHENTEECNISIDIENNPSGTVQPFIEYYCNICTTKFKKLEFFFNHNCTTESQEPVYSCHLCNMSFPGRISLIEHMEVHFNDTN